MKKLAFLLLAATAVAACTKTSVEEDTYENAINKKKIEKTQATDKPKVRRPGDGY